MYNTIESVNESTEALCRKLSTIKVNENKALYFKALRSETIKSCFPLGQTYKPTIILN